VVEGPTILRFDIEDCPALTTWIDSWIRVIRDRTLGNGISFTIEKVEDDRITSDRADLGEGG
jgi:hypothetical protein